MIKTFFKFTFIVEGLFWWLEIQAPVRSVLALQELTVSGKRQILKQKVSISSAKGYGGDEHSMLSLEKGEKKYFKTDLLEKVTFKINFKVL